MKYKGVIFDLDGTLLDSLEDIASCVNRVLKRHGFSSHASEKYRHFAGDGMYTLLLRALPPEQRREDFIKQCVQEMKMEYAQHWEDKTRPYAEIPELLQELQRKKIKLAVFSNKLDEFTKIMVTRFFPGQFVEVRGERSGIPQKPDPQGALAIAKAMQILPQEFLYLGDTNTDMQTAVAAEMLPVGVLWGFREAAELQASGAKLLIEKPLDLLSKIPMI